MDWRPLHAAAYNADLEQVSELLDRGAVVDEVDQAGMTPLLWSSFRGLVGDQTPVVTLLIAKGGDPNAVQCVPDADWDARAAMNCLMYAVQSGALPVVEALLRGGARANDTVGGMTALMIAAADGSHDFVDLLLARGADASIKCGSYDAAGYARHHGRDELADLLERAAGLTP
jgi:ankyrin repeat protein